MAAELQGDEAIEVDGRLDEAAWAVVPWTERMVDITQHADTQRNVVPEDTQGRVKVRWDRDYLYVGAEVHV